MLDTTAVRLHAPRAAAIAGILFSVLLIASIVLLRLAVPPDPLDAGAWLATRADTVALSLLISLYILIDHARPKTAKRGTQPLEGRT